MQCNEFLAYAERWMEGERGSAAAAHLEACPRCRGVIADLHAIHATARDLGGEVQPPARLWGAIRTQLEAEGLIREQSRSWTAGWADLLVPRPRLALAGAYLALMLAAAVLVSFESAERYEEARALGVTPPALASLPDHLRHAGDRTAASFRSQDPRVTASYRESLRTIDGSILECEGIVRRDPQNELAREYLYSAYQQKAELLSAMVERGAYGE